MMAADPDNGATRDPMFLRACAVFAIAGFAAMIAGNVIGSIVVPGHDWVAHTISDLGAGEGEIVQDVAFYAYAAGLLALAMGLSHDHRGGWRWTIGIFALAVLAGSVIVIGARNEYGDGDDEGVVIHIYLVYLLAVMLLLAPLALAPGLKHWHPAYRGMALVFALAWAVAAPLFFVVPTSIDGLWERAIGLLATAWLASLAVGLWRHSG